MASNSTSHPALDDPTVFLLYRYTPSLPAAVIFIVLFTITTSLHLWQMIRARAWYLIPLTVGGLFEMIGYIGRAISSQNQWTLGPYIIQAVLILVAPALFAASIYMTLGRIILLVDGEKYALINRRWLTRIFVIGDVVSFLTQASGAGIMTGKTSSSLQVGQDIIVVGLFLQIVSFGLFVTIALVFHYRVLRHPTSLSTTESGITWKKHLYVLYTVSVIIFVRSIFRAIEYIMGNDGYIMRHEEFLYIFDAVLMLAVLVVFNVFHPGEIMRFKKQTGSIPLVDHSSHSTKA